MARRRETAEKVPHVHGYSEASMLELMDEMPAGMVEYGYDRFCMRWRAVGLCGLGMSEKGEV